MNKHIVDSEELRKFMQNQYDIMVDLIKCYDSTRKELGIVKTKLYFEEQTKLFKITIDLHN